MWDERASRRSARSACFRAHRFGLLLRFARWATSAALSGTAVKRMPAANAMVLASIRIAWSQLLRRTYWVDVLTCDCGGHRAIVGDISEREVIVAILAHLGLPTEAPPMARARSPAFEGA